MDVDHFTQESPLFETVDDVLELINPYGPFQWIMIALLSVVYSGGFLHTILPYFLSLEPAWRCVANSTICNYNTTVDVRDGERCKLPRSEWEYTEPRDLSVVSQFDLICERAWLGHLLASCLYIGWAIGALFVGRIADRYGRKIIVIPTVTLIFVVAIFSAFTPNIWMLLASRFVIGVLISGGSPVSLILMGEFVDTEHRPVSLVIMYCAHAIGYMVLCAQAYFVRQWRYLLIACTIPYLFLPGFYKFIPESIHWLHARGLNEQLDDVFKKIAYWNKVTLPGNNLSRNLVRSRQENNDGGLKEIFLSRVLLARTAILSFGWFTVVMVFFGLSFGADDLGGSVYVNFILVTFIEIPANIFVLYSSRNFGRKLTVCGSMILAAAACLALFFVSGNSSTLRLVLGILGKACICIAYNSLYIWSFEMYATTNRGSGVGFLTFIGRCGGASAPWVVKGLKVANDKLPFVIMGGSGMICGLLSLMLPETKHLATCEIGRVNENDCEEYEELLREENLRR